MRKEIRMKVGEEWVEGKKNEYREEGRRLPKTAPLALALGQQSLKRCGVSAPLLRGRCSGAETIWGSEFRVSKWLAFVRI